MKQAPFPPSIQRQVTALFLLRGLVRELRAIEARSSGQGQAKREERP